MKIFVVSLFFAANAISKVDSACFNLNPLAKDFKNMCEQWWDKSEDSTSFGSSIKQCISLINEKCPDILEIQTTTERAHEDVRGEVWLVKTTATHKVKGTRRISNEFEDRPLCWDNDGKFEDCSFWWGIATETTIDNDRRDYCIQNITKHCENKITKVKETSICDIQKCRKGFEVRAVTYQNDKGETATVNREVSL